VGKFFIPIKFYLSALNLWIGVQQAGIFIRRNIADLSANFTIPAGAAALLWWRSFG
jgi:hypothetical protein